MFGEKNTITIKVYFVVVTLNLSQREYFVPLIYSIFELFAREVVDKPQEDTLGVFRLGRVKSLETLGTMVVVIGLY